MTAGSLLLRLRQNTTGVHFTHQMPKSADETLKTITEVPGHRGKTMLHRNAVGFAGVALCALLTLSVARAEETKPLPHPGPWPIQHGHNLQPRADLLEAMRREDLTAQESRDIDRLYGQLEASSQKMLEHSHESR